MPNKLKFLASGAVGSPLVVGAYFGGTMGNTSTPSTIYRIPKPEDVLIVFGLNSTDLRSKDAFTQFARVGDKMENISLK